MYKFLITSLSTAAFLMLGVYFFFAFKSQPPILASQEAWCGGAVNMEDDYQKVPLPPYAQTADLELGESLFKANCASCHHPSRNLTGPALGDALSKYEADTTFLYDWVRNAPEMIRNEDPKAIALSNWGAGKMMAFPSLENHEVKESQ